MSSSNENPKNKLIKYATSAFFLAAVILGFDQLRALIALNDYSMLPSGVKVTKKFHLARGNRLKHSRGIIKKFRRGNLVLVCTNEQEILLIMKTYIHGLVGLGASDEAYMSIGGINNSVDLKRLTIASENFFDTIVSDPLSNNEIKSIVNAVNKKQSKKISVSMLEGASFFSGNPNISSLKTFINNCLYDCFL